MRQRWGSLSVRDHTAAELLVPELILYDRLIIPTRDLQDDREHWDGPWDGRLQEHRLAQLGDLAITRPWNEARRTVYANRLAVLQAERADANGIAEEVRNELGYQLTRRILAQEAPGRLPEGVTHVEVVSAYPSEESLQAEFFLSPAEGADDAAHLSLLIGQRLAIPAGEDAENTLDDTIGLVRSPEFQERRRELYAWQRQAFTDGYRPESAILELERLVGRFNECVGEATGTVLWRLGFTVGAAALALAAAPGSLLAGSAALLGVVSFATLDRKPAVQAGEATPAAVFHDVATTLGVEFRDS